MGGGIFIRIEGYIKGYMVKESIHVGSAYSNMSSNCANQQMSHGPQFERGGLTSNRYISRTKMRMKLQIDLGMIYLRVYSQIRISMHFLEISI